MVRGEGREEARSGSISPFTYLVSSLYLAIVLFGILKCFAAHPIDFQPHLGRRMKYGKHLLYLLNIYYIPDTGLNALHSLIDLIITVILWGTYYYR